MRPLAQLLDEVARRGIALEPDGDGLRVRAPAGAVDAALRAELARRKPELIAHLTGGRSMWGPTAVVASDEPAPLTFNQRRLWFIEKLGGTGGAFIMSAAWHLEGLSDSAPLRCALARLIDRHAALRTRIVEADGEPRQVVDPPCSVEVVEEGADAAGLAELIDREASAPFVFARDTLFQVRLFRVGPDRGSLRHLLLMRLHHLVGDRWSIGILLRDLAALVEAELTGGPAALPALPLQFPDFAAWQRARQTSATLAQGLDYWQRQLAGAPSEVSLPFDRPRPPTRGTKGGARRFSLPTDADLSALAARNGASPFMAYLALYAALLARWSGQDDIVIGCPMGNREHPQTRDVVGFFVNTVALRLDLSDDPGFTTLMERARAASLAAFEYQDVPFDRIVDALRPDRRLNTNPLFQAMFVLQNADMEPLHLPGCAVAPVELPDMAPEVDFSLTLQATGEASRPFDAYLEYDPDLFDPATADRFGRHFKSFAAAVASKPDVPLSRVSIAVEPFASWSGLQVAPPSARLEQAILARLRADPDATAVMDADGRTVTSGALAARSASIAVLLVGRGVTVGSVVALHLPRGSNLVAAILAVLDAGATFVLLSPDLPGEQRDRIVQVAQPTLVLTEADIVSASGVKTPPTSPPSDAPAYICFTSGTSGQPKGIVIGRQALANHAHAVVESFGLIAGDRVLQFAAPGFDVALEEILPTLLAGGTIVVPPVAALEALDTFADVLQDAAVTVANLPAPFWHAWVRELQASGRPVPSSLRLLVTGSDRVHADAARAWQALAPTCRWLSGYGPSETTITATLFDPARESLAPGMAHVPLGQPLHNVGVHVVDADGHPLPTGLVGEIVIEGMGLADGYLAGGPQDAFRSLRPGGPRVYWTGDLGRRSASGALEFLGRRDAQLKVRGIRVEPAAIEAVLAGHPAAGEVAVTGRADSGGNLILCATLTGQADADDLRRWAARFLAPQMVPGVFERVASLPRTPSGKIDRRALAARPLQREEIGPRTFANDRERLIAGIFAEVLDCGDIGPDSNFFGLGGDSIRSLQIVARARRAGLSLSARTIFEHQTVAGIAAAATEAADQTDGPSGLGPLPFTPISAWFHQEAMPDWHHFNQAVVLSVPQPVDVAALRKALTAIVMRHDMLRITVHSGSPPRHEIPASVPAPGLEVFEGTDPGAQRARIEAAQTSLDPRQGRNIAAILFPADGHLLLTVHHLSIDVLSWGIVLDDLESAYAQAVLGSEPRLPPVPTPFRLWAERLQDVARAPQTRDALTFWRRRLDRKMDRLLPDAGDDPGFDADARSIQRTASRTLTSDLVRAVPAMFGVRTDVAIMAALQMVLRQRGGTQQRIDLERNGRVSPFADLDLSRTVGWFTALLPVVIEQDSSDIAALLRSISDTVAEMPLDGLSYGLLRYLGNADSADLLAALPRAEILLNYVGELSGWNRGRFRPVDRDVGPTIAPTTARSHMLELNAGIIDGRLRLDVNYSCTAVQAADVERVLDALIAALEEIALAARRSRIGDNLPADAEDMLALTPLQRGMLIHSLRQPDTYFDQIRLTLVGPIDAGALRATWQALTDRHPALRSSFRFGMDGQPVQIVHENIAPGWIELDWSDCASAEQQRRMTLLMAADRAAGFDLAKAPLLRLHLVRMASDRHDLLWSTHHLLADGWSVSILMAEFAALYRARRQGASTDLPTAPSFGRYVRWLAETDQRAAQAHWASELRGFEEPVLLAPPFAGEVAASEEPVAITLPLVERTAIEALARQAGVTVGTVVQCAWAVVLHRYTGIADTMFGMTVSGRPPELDGAEAIVGMLINTLPIRVQVPRDATIATWLRQTGAQAAERAPHVTLSLPEILEAAGLAGTGLPFDTLLLVQNYPRPSRLDAGDLDIRVAEVVEATDLPITVVVDWPAGADTRITLLHKDRAGSIASHSVLRHLRQILREMAANPDGAVDALSIHDDAGRFDLLAMARGPALDVPAPFLHQMLDEWAELIPSAPAVSGMDGAMDYRTLALRSTAIAAALAAHGVRPGDHVVLALPRSTAAIAAFFAILKAGAAVVPLDVNYPPERLRFILSDCRPAAILTDEQHCRTLPLPTGVPVLLPQDIAGPPDGSWTAPVVAPENTAYVIYTSGSTGNPKGVLSPHRGLRALAAAQRGIFALGPGRRVLQFASLSFDASVWEIAMAMGAGAALLVPDRREALAGAELATWMRDKRINAATLPPSLLAMMPADAYPDLDILVVAGEACPPHLARQWAQGRRFFNAYGPSEATVCATIFEGGGDGHVLPIGRALPNVEAYVLDQGLRPVPVGGTGELVIGGIGVATGYLDRADLSAERFIADPFSPRSTTSLYRTGDRVQLRPDGNLVFLGRMDRQVKLRGFRIEPAEVEQALAALPGVAQALAGVRADDDGQEQLLAWILPKKGAQPDPAVLRRQLGDRVPAHMVPAAIIPIHSVPLTGNGKIDWPALPGPAAPTPAITRIADGTDTLEDRVRRIWCDLLDRPSIDTDDNFFDLGGHSLLLVRLQAALKQAFGLAVPIRDLFAHATLRALVAHLVELGVEVVATAAAPVANGEPIAVIGMAGRFPGAPDLDAYWTLLTEGREGLQKLDAATLRAAGRREDEANRTGFVAAAGLLQDAECFDHALFGLAPRDATILDPQHRVLLECAWHALEDAGHAPGAGKASIGLFAGSGYNTWLREVLVPAGESLTGSGGFHLVSGNDKDFLATQIAYRLDLKGPAINVQTACSTSLVAVAMAVEALRADTCDMALAGGVSISFPQGRGYQYETDMILSPDGHCRPFAADAAGTVPSAGAGIVVLKRLSRAVADGDRILAVIRGVAVNNDGARKMGYAAPGVAGQADALAKALAVAGLQRDDVDYVEAHGTGTALGDPVEITALARAYGGRREPLLIGSAKGNIGHADTAAGIAGFIKAVLALHRGLIPATLHAERRSPRIDWASGPFEPVTRTRSWPVRDRPSRAGVSSFGIGGTNAHVILEAAPVTQSAAPSPDDPRILPLSAHTDTALQQRALQLARCLDMRPDIALADVATTLQDGRTPLRHRRVIVAHTVKDAVQALQRTEATKPLGDPPRLALLFPGQGSQHVRMGHALYQAGGVFRRTLDELSDSLRAPLGLSLVDLLYASDGNADTLRATEIAQPALFAVSLALARQWQGLGVRPDGMLGHSVGEYVAAHLAGMFSLDDALALVVERGRLVAGLPGGAMVAIELAEADLHPLIAETRLPVALAAINGPNLCVASGSHDVIAELEQSLQQRRIGHQRLHTSHAFHSPMMAPAAASLANAVARIRPKAPTHPFVSNVTGTWITAAEATDPAYWARQLVEPVRFSDGIGTLRAGGINLGVECGPGQTLTALARTNGLASLPSSAHAAAEPAGGSAIHNSVAELWRRGISVHWQSLRTAPTRRVALPLYPFDRVRHAPAKPAMPDHPLEGLVKQAPASWFYRPDWEAADGAAVAMDGPWLLLSDNGGLGEAIAARLRDVGMAVATVRCGSTWHREDAWSFTARPDEAADFELTLRALPALPRRVLHLWSLDAGAPARRMDKGLHALLAVVTALGRVMPGHKVRLDLVTRGGTDCGSDEGLDPFAAAAIGAVQVLPTEYPELDVHVFDLLGATAMQATEHVMTELALAPTGNVIAWRDGTRWRPAMVPTALPQPSYVPPTGATVLITGAFGGVGAAIARDFCRVPGIRLILQGRMALSSGAADADDEVRRRLALVHELESAGATVMTPVLDLADAVAVRQMIDEASARFGRLTGIVHAAGLADWGGAVQRRTRVDTDNVLAPKIAGTLALETALVDRPPDFMVLCSTLGSLLPGAKFGQVAYAAANAFLDLAAADIARRRGWRTIAINWDDWVERGMSVAAARRMGRQHAGKEHGLTDAEGAAALRKILSAPYRRIAVSVHPLPQVMALYRNASASAEHAPPPSPDAPLGTDIQPLRDQDALVEQVTTLFRQVLDDQAFGPDDNFFERGGHSLLAMQILNGVRDRLGFPAGLVLVFDHPTPRRMADHIRRGPGN